MVEPIDTNVSGDNRLENLNALVKQYASQLGLDETSGEQLFEILSNTDFDNNGLNKYNLSESVIKQINDAIDNGETASYINLLLQGHFTQLANQNTVSSNQITEDSFKEAMNVYAATNGDTLAALAVLSDKTLDRAYKPGNISRKVPVYENGKPKFENGVPVTTVFTGHFSNDYHFLINSLSDPSDIKNFQRYLIENNIVAPDTFIGSEGTYSSALEAAVVTVMNYLDTEFYIAPGTTEWNQIMDRDTIFFSLEQAENYTIGPDGYPVPNPEAVSKDQEAKLFAFAVEEMSKDFEKFASYQEAQADEALINQLKSQYQVLSPLQREDQVEEWFQTKLGRKGSKKEIEDWANNIALNYSSVFKQLVKDYQNLQSASSLGDWEKSYLAAYGKNYNDLQFKSFDEMTDISAQLAQEDALLQAESMFEKSYGEQIESYEIGKKSIQEDKDILRMMYG